MKSWEPAFVAQALIQNRAVWSNEQLARHYLQTQFKERFELNDPAICQQRCDFFAIPDSCPEDYCEKFVAVPGGRLLAGIRFRNLERGFPFLEVQADLSWQGILAHWPEIVRALQRVFGVFSPRGLTLRLPANQPLPAQAEIWNDYLVGPLKQRDDIAQTHPAFSPAYQLIQPAQILDQARYLEEYRRWGEQHPELAGRVSPESAQDLQDAHQAGLYFELQVQNQVVGIIAGQSVPYWDQQGLYVIEELIFVDQQRKGYGRILQTLFQQALQNQFNCIWGTIHPQNKASLHTALACGRQITEQEVFFSFAFQF